MNTHYSVFYSRQFEKTLYKIPKQVLKKLKFWVAAVEMRGIFEVRKISSFHDEPLQGNRFGQRSIRLSKSYRAFYVMRENGAIHFIEVLEVNKHGY